MQKPTKQRTVNTETGINANLGSTSAFFQCKKLQIPVGGGVGKGSLLIVRHEKAEPQRTDLGHFFIGI